MALEWGDVNPSQAPTVRAAPVTIEAVVADADYGTTTAFRTALERLISEELQPFLDEALGTRPKQ